MSKIAQDTTKAGLGCRCGACLGGVLRGIAHRQRECALAHISLYGRIWPYMALSKKLRFVEISAQPATAEKTPRWGGGCGMLANPQRAIKKRRLVGACARYFGGIADDDELNINPPTPPCQIGKRPPAPKPKRESAGHQGAEGGGYIFRRHRAPQQRHGAHNPGASAHARSAFWCATGPHTAPRLRALFFLK